MRDVRVRTYLVRRLMRQCIVLASVLIIVSVLGLVAWRELRPVPDSVAINNPCNTFVSEFAPVETPLLRKAGVNLQLVLSFTPAQDAEADSVISAVSAGTKNLLVSPDQRPVRAVRIEQGRLVLLVESSSHAAEVLKLMCFDEKYRNPKLQPAS